jgi:DUF177 domain-containing protein
VLTTPVLRRGKRGDAAVGWTVGAVGGTLGDLPTHIVVKSPTVAIAPPNAGANLEVVGQRTEIFDLGRLSLSSGEGRRLHLEVPVAAFDFGGQGYAVPGGTVGTTLDVSHTTSGYSLRLRFETELEGPCMRCLEDAGRGVEVDAREVDQPGGGDDLRSPYLDGDDLDLRAWARDALALALPAQIVCREDCLGLCSVCGENLNVAAPGHAHEREPDPRWAALRELKLD